MSNVKIILVGDATEGLKYSTLGVHFAKKARKDGLKHGQSTNNYVDNVHFRVNLDDYTGDKCYIQMESCPTIQYSGFLDTYPAWSTYTMGEPPLRLKELQEDIENLPRTRGGVEIPGNPVMHGLRKTKPNNGEYPKVSVARQSNDEDFRKFFASHNPAKYSGIMRKAMQATFATSTWAEALTYKTSPESPRKSRTNFVWGDSWGIVLNGDGSKGSHYFLIQIMSAEVRWVHASICVHKYVTGAETIYAPVIRSIDNTRVVNLGTIPTGATSQKEHIGWAFSYDTQEASAVLFEYDGERENQRARSKVATVNIVFRDGVPSAVTYGETAWHTMWTNSGDPTVQIFSGKTHNDVPVITSLYPEIRYSAASAPYSFRAPVGVFYKKSGGRVVVECENTVTNPEVEVKGYGTPVYGGSFSGGLARYNVSATPTGYMIPSVQSGSITTRRGDTHAVVVNGVSTPRDTESRTESGTINTLYQDDAVFSSRSYSALDITRKIDSTYAFEYFPGWSIFVSLVGSRSRAYTTYASTACPTFYDREAFFVSSRKTDYSESVAGVYAWRALAHFTRIPNGAGFLGYQPDNAMPWGHVFPTSSPAFEAVSYGSEQWPEEGYYITPTTWGDGYNVTSVPMPAGAALPQIAPQPPPKVSDTSSVITSNVEVEVADGVMLQQLLMYHDPYTDDNDTFSPFFMASAFSNAYVIGRVVHLGGKEYNAENAVTGWIGVV